MHLIILTALSFAGGWLVNLAADALPNRITVRKALGIQVLAVRCAFRRSADDSCIGLHTIRTSLTYVAALVFGVMAYVRYGFSIDAIVVAVYAWYLLAIAIIDIEHRKVLNRMLLAALPVVAATVIFVGVPTIQSAIVGVPTIQSAIYGAMIGLGVFMLAALIRPGGMGMGDVKLAGLIGFATGVGGVAIALIIGVISGGVAGFVMLLRSKNRKSTMAYAPYLAFGAWVALYFGAEIVILIGALAAVSCAR